MIATIQVGIPVARIELLDELQMRACNGYSKLELREAPTLFFEFHGSEAGVAEQAEHGAGDRRRAWRRRLPVGDAAGGAQPAVAGAARRLLRRPGAAAGRVGWATDVCVPISRLAECIAGDPGGHRGEPGLLAPIVGHVGDGNFHLPDAARPGRPGGDGQRAEAVNERLVGARSPWAAPAPASTASASARSTAWREEHGAAVDVMRRSSARSTRRTS